MALNSPLFNICRPSTFRFGILTTGHSDYSGAETEVDVVYFIGVAAVFAGKGRWVEEAYTKDFFAGS
jgi:hypothetical protein